MHEQSIRNADRILRGYLKDVVNKAGTIEERFLDFITTLSAISATFAVLIPTLGNSGTNLVCLIFAELFLLFSIISGIVIRWNRFANDAETIPLIINELIGHLNVLWSQTSSLEEKQKAIDYADSNRTINFPKKSGAYWTVLPLFVGIFMIILAFFIPILDNALQQRTLNENRSEIIVNHSSGSLQLNVH